MEKGCTVSDYTVTIGLGQCEDLELNTNSLLCKLPEDEPESAASGSREDGVLQVDVSVFSVDNYYYTSS